MKQLEPLDEMDEPAALFSDPIGAIPAIYLTKIRDTHSAFDTPRSWLGGYPPLDVKDWPRTSDGFAMYHLATLDLEAIALVAPASALPKTGKLTVFVESERETGGVHVMHIIAPKPPVPSGPLPDIFEHPKCGHLWAHVSQTRPAEETRVLPRWPLRISTSPADPSAATGIHINAQSLAVILPRGAQPWMWDSAQRLIAGLHRRAEELQRAVIRAQKNLETAQGRLAALVSSETVEDAQTVAQWINAAEKKVRLNGIVLNLAMQGDAYQAFCTRMQKQADAHDPWEVMSNSDLIWLQTLARQLYFNALTARSGRFGACYALSARRGYQIVRTTQNGRMDLSNLTDDTLIALAAAPVSVFRSLPHDLQDAITRVAQGRSHRMFGTADHVMESTNLNAQKHLLLEISAYHLAGIFGQGSASFCVYMRGKDLRAKDWHKAELVFGHTV